MGVIAALAVTKGVLAWTRRVSSGEFTYGHAPC